MTVSLPWPFMMARCTSGVISLNLLAKSEAVWVLSTLPLAILTTWAPSVNATVFSILAGSIAIHVAGDRPSPMVLPETALALSTPQTERYFLGTRM